MQTECGVDRFGFAPVERRAVLAAFDGGRMTSDAGALLLGMTDRAIGLVERFAECFADNRVPELIEHGVGTLVGQHVLAIALGYEDLVDHDQLRHDPTLAVLADKLAARRKDCAPLAGKSILNRLELGGSELTRYHRIAWGSAKIEALFVESVSRGAPAVRPNTPSSTSTPPTTRCTGIRRARLSRLLRLLLLSAAAHLLRGASAGDPTALRQYRRLSRRGRGDRALVAQIRTRWPEVRVVL